VALKPMRGNGWRDAREVARLKRELQLACKITHPGICRIYDFGTDGEGARQVPFLTMELVVGETLAQRIARSGRLWLAEALPLARAVLTDFGLARLSAVGATSSASSGARRTWRPSRSRAAPSRRRRTSTRSVSSSTRC
jgi:hypothetical protein